MDLAMLFGATFLSLCNGLDKNSRGHALDMLQHFAGSETFSPAEQHVLQTIVSMADDVFTPAADHKLIRGRPHLRLVN